MSERKPQRTEQFSDDDMKGEETIIKEFKEEYEKLEQAIKDKTRAKTKITKQIREVSLQLDAIKRNVNTRLAKLNEKESILKSKQSKLQNMSFDKSSEKVAYDKAMQKQEVLKVKIEKMRKEFEKAKILIENEEAKLRDIRPSAIDYSLVENNINYIRSRVESKRKMLAQKSQAVAEAQQQIKVLTADEQKLKATKTVLESKQDELEDRRAETQRVLSEPIDNLQYEEALVLDAERDAAETERRHNGLQVDEGFEKNVQIISELNSQESANNERRAILEKRQANLEQQKKQYQTPIKSPQKKLNDVSDIKSPEPLKTNAAETMMEQIAAQLNEKLEKVAKDEAEIDQMELANAQQRKAVEAQWKGRIEKISQLRERVRLIESLVMQAGELNASIDAMEHESLDNQQSIAQLKRRNENADRDRNRNAGARLTIEQLREKLKEREQANKDMDVHLEQLRQENEEMEAALEKEEEALKGKQAEVDAAEAEVKEFAAKLEKATERMKQQQALINKFLEEHPMARNDTNDMVGALADLISKNQ